MKKITLTKGAAYKFALDHLEDIAASQGLTDIYKHDQAEPIACIIPGHRFQDDTGAPIPENLKTMFFREDVKKAYCPICNRELDSIDLIMAYNAKYNSYAEAEAAAYDLLDIEIVDKEEAGRIQIPDDVIFITGNEKDAAAINDAGFIAVTLSDPAEIRSFCNAARQSAAAGPFICLDTFTKDQIIKEGLNAYQAKNIGGVDPVHEAYKKDPNSVIFNLTCEATTASEAAVKAKEDMQRANGAAVGLERLKDFITQSADAGHIETGLSSLDQILDGGLFPGLYILGAIPSLGKTTFALQLADNIAASGKDVYFFALEMGAHELVAKSISRLTRTASMELYGTEVYAKTQRGVMDGSAYATYTDAEKTVINRAMELYSDTIAPHLYIKNGMGDFGIDEIRKAVAQHARNTGSAPVVIVDYLQIMAAPKDTRLDDKQRISQAVKELKRLSANYNIPVLAITSFNRGGYGKPVDMTSGKESGDIEYSADVLIGMQYNGMDYHNTINGKPIDELSGEDLKAIDLDHIRPEYETEEARNGRAVVVQSVQELKGKAGLAQTIHLKVLKNRNGVKGSCRLSLLPAYSLYKDIDEFTPTEDEPPAQFNLNDFI